MADKTGQIEIRISGRQGAFDLVPATYDVKHVIATLQHAEGLLFGSNKKERPLLTYDIQEGSVRHILTTALQAVIGFNAILGTVQQQGDIDFLQPETAQALEYFQSEARQHDYQVEVKTSVADTVTLVIDATTQYARTAASWVEAEFYFYGRITDMGGTSRPNIHLQTAEAGRVTLQTTQETLKQLEGNYLYREYGVRATGQQDLRTGEVNRQSLQLVDIVDYEARFDAHYLATLRRKAARNDWPQDPDTWLRELRGYTD